MDESRMNLISINLEKSISRSKIMSGGTFSTLKSTDTDDTSSCQLADEIHALCSHHWTNQRGLVDVASWAPNT